MADLGSKGYLVLEPGTSKEEIIKFTGITGNTLTGVIRGLAFYGTSEAGVPANAFSHQSGSIAIMSNVNYVYKNFVDRDTNETIDGVKTFSSFPEFGTPSTLPTTDGQFATKKYVDDTAISGASKATDTVYGISKLSIAAVSPVAPIAVGDNDPRVPTQAENDFLGFLTGGLPGVVFPYAGSSAPSGFFFCDGAAISRTTYAALFSVVGTTFGFGDNSTTFNIPNLKNRIPMGLDTSAKIVIDNCDAAWTAGSNVVATNDASDKKEGTASVKLAVAAGAVANQILGYKALSSTSFAGKTIIGMWIKSDISLNSGDLKYQLDDTAALASPIESINIPALTAGVWTKIYLTLATPWLDTAIISHGIYQVVDKGVFNLWIDDINSGENYEVGAAGGEKTHTLAIAEIPAHTHTTQGNNSGGGVPGTLQEGSINNAGTNGSYTTSDATGGSQTHNNLQPYITLNYIIKY